MKKFLIQIALLLTVIGVSFYLYKSNFQISNLPFLPESPVPVYKQLRINNTILKVEIADTQAKRNRGLGGRETLASDEGMLFIFSKPDKHSFWMKGLNFPLDFVWIRGESIIDILQNVQPPTPGQADSSLPIYQSREEVDKVLEVPAGTTARLNIKIGYTVKLI